MKKQIHFKYISSLITLAAAALFVKLAAAYAVLDYASGARWVWDLQYDLRYSYRAFIEQILSGSIPYVDFGIEYPVGAGIFFWLFSLAVGLGTDYELMRNYSLLLSAVDVLNVLLLFAVVWNIAPRRAFPIALFYALLPTGLVIGPYRLEFLVASFVLGGFLLYQRRLPGGAAAAWAIGFAIKWYPAFIFAAQELRDLRQGKGAKRVIRQGSIFVLVALLINLPFMILNCLRSGSLTFWLHSYVFHLERSLSKDTVLGVWALWFGRPPIEEWAGYTTLALMAFVLLYRKSLPLAHKGAAVCMSALVLNRTYSPQFHLWFIPLLLVAIAYEPRRRAVVLLFLLACLEIINATIFPFLFVHLVDIEFAQAAAAGPLTVLCSALVLMRALLLVVLIWLLLSRETLRGSYPEIGLPNEQEITMRL